MEKQFIRLKNGNQKLGGICEGLGAMYDFDPTLLRIALVVGLFSPMSFFLFATYSILWMILPATYSYSKFSMSDNNNETSYSVNHTNKIMRRNSSKNGNVVGGLILIILGTFFAINQFFHVNLFSYIGKMWPLFIIGLGIWIIMKDKDDNSGFDNNSPGIGGEKF